MAYSQDDLTLAPSPQTERGIDRANYLVKLKQLGFVNYSDRIKSTVSRDQTPLSIGEEATGVRFFIGLFAQ
jgi:hypothetical protein